MAAPGIKVRQGYPPRVGGIFIKIAECRLGQFPSLVAVGPPFSRAYDDIIPSFKSDNGLILGNGRIASLDSPVWSGNPFCFINRY
jgi:hypothetical protein